MAIKDWPGGTITDIPVEPSGNYEDSAASGVWTVDQVSDWLNNYLVDSERDLYGAFNETLITNSTAGNGSFGGGFIPLSDGFTLPDSAIFDAVKESVTWTFRKKAKFFDIVTYSSDTTSGARTISHNLGSTPAFIIVKGLNFSDAWYVYHIGTGVNKYLELNLTGTAVLNLSGY